MKTLLLFLLISFSTQLIFSQKIILHRNSEGNQTFQLSSVDSISFLPFACGDEIRYEGKTYHTVLIGAQCWMKENLNVGAMIQGNTNQSNNGLIEKYCYNNDTANCTIYGGLYKWDEAMQYVTTSGAKGICPEGWHIPTLLEFQTLDASVGNNGNSLKAIGQGGGAGAGTNSSEFSALLSGFQQFGGSFHNIGTVTYIRSSSENNGTNAFVMYLDNTSNSLVLFANLKEFGLSLRCLKNQ